MKIACVCNANNFFLPLVQYLRDNGYDAELLVLENDVIGTGNPEWDSFDYEFNKFTKFVNWGFYPQGFFQAKSKEVADDLKQYEFIIAQGHAPAFINKAGRLIDIFMPNGGDIIHIPFIPKNKNYNLKMRLKYWYFSKHHLKGIRSAKYIFLDKMNNKFEILFKSINTRGKRVHTSCPFIYTPMYNSVEIKKHYSDFYYYEKIRELKNQGHILLLNHSRQIWSDFFDKFSVKGNDRLINGFSLFVKDNPNEKIKLIMLEYGDHVERSKKLVEDLEITNQVIWLPKLKRKEIMMLISLCDVATGQFGESWLSSGAIGETLAMSKPLIHYRDDSLYTNYNYLYPILKAKEPEEIAKQLKEFVINPKKFYSMGEMGCKWFREYGINHSLKKYLEIINEKI